MRQTNQQENHHGSNHVEPVNELFKHVVEAGGNVNEDVLEFEHAIPIYQPPKYQNDTENRTIGTNVSQKHQKKKNKNKKDARSKSSTSLNTDNIGKRSDGHTTSPKSAQLKNDVGVYAKQDIKRGTLLANIPISMCICVPTALRFPGIGDLLRSWVEKKSIEELDLLAVFLMWLRYRKYGKVSSAMKWFFDSLPPPPHLEDKKSKFKDPWSKQREQYNTFHQTIFWSEEELQALQGTKNVEMSLRLKSQLQTRFNSLKSDLIEKNRKVFPREDEQTHFSFDMYLWACAVIWSRCNELEKAGPNGETLRMIVPIVNIFRTAPNHSVRSGYFFNSKKQCVTILAGEDFKTGEEVFLNRQTELKNSQKLAILGYVEEDDEKDPLYLGKISDIEMVMNIDPTNPGIQKALQTFLKDDFPYISEGNQVAFQLTWEDPVPENLIKTLLAQKAEEQSEAFRKVGVFKELLEVLQYIKQNYDTTKEECRRLLKSNKSKNLPIRYRYAIILKLGEMILLDRVIETTQETKRRALSELVAEQGILPTKSNLPVEEELGQLDELD